MAKSFFRTSRKPLSNGLFVFLASAASLFAIETALLSRATPAAFPSDEPVLLAQQMNGRVAHLVCGSYDIIIRFVGPAGSSEFSYQSHGIYLENGI
ncbi:hypothetical protein HC928_10285 [bacterium]|nr:hypothetical protein [bacterium]